MSALWKARLRLVGELALTAYCCICFLAAPVLRVRASYPWSSASLAGRTGADTSTQGGHHMPANRVAAIAGILTSIGAFTAAVAGAFPGKYAGAAVAAAAVLAKLAVTLKFLDGSQKHEARQAIQHPYVVSSSSTGSIGSIRLTSGLADEEPGDPDGAPGIPTSIDPPADGNDQVHA